MDIEAHTLIAEVEEMQAPQQFHPGSGDTYRLHLMAAHRLQSQAWEAYNSAFHAPEADEYRRAGAELYRRVIEERLRALYLRGDEQNLRIDSGTRV